MGKQKYIKEKEKRKRARDTKNQGMFRLVAAQKNIKLLTPCAVLKRKGSQWIFTSVSLILSFVPWSLTADLSLC